MYTEEVNLARRNWHKVIMKLGANHPTTIKARDKFWKIYKAFDKAERAKVAWHKDLNECAKPSADDIYSSLWPERFPDHKQWKQEFLNRPIFDMKTIERQFNEQFYSKPLVSELKALQREVNTRRKPIITASQRAGKTFNWMFCDETDYLDNSINKFKEEGKMRNKRADYRWTTANGEEIDIEHMETSHIENTIIFLFRKKRDAELALVGVTDKFMIKLIDKKIKENLAWISKMRAELMSRSADDVVTDIYGAEDETE